MDIEFGSGDDAITLTNRFNGDLEIQTGEGDDQITLTSETAQGSVSVITGAGDDVVTTGDRDVTIETESGNDTVVTGNGNNTINTGEGEDTVQIGHGNNTITTGSGDDAIDIGDGDNTITTGDGNDIVQAGNGRNIVTTEGGDDTITSGNGDNTIDAGEGNNTVFTGTGNDVISAGDGDNFINAGRGDNIVTAGAGDNIVESGEGDNVINAGDGNNIINAGNGDNTISTGSGSDLLDTVMITPGHADETTYLRFSWVGKQASYNNEIGVFILDDNLGRVNGIAPGEAGYAQAALTSATRQTLFVSGETTGAWEELSLQGGTRLGFYLLQDSTHQEWLTENPENELDGGPLVFFSLNGANPDGTDHAQSRTLSPGVWQFAWEDMVNGGDQDFNDVVFVAHEVSAETPALTGSSKRALFEWLSNGGANRNEIGLFFVDDAFGRIGNLLPGQAGYTQAALGNERHKIIFTQGQTEGARTEIDLPEQQYVGWYIIENATSDQFLTENPDNLLDSGPKAFFSFAGANPDGLNHLRPVGDNILAWEDETNGGDFDYNDLVFRYNLDVPSTQAVLASTQELEADQVSTGQMGTAPIENLPATDNNPIRQLVKDVARRSILSVLWNREEKE